MTDELNKLAREAAEAVACSPQYILMEKYMWRVYNLGKQDRPVDKEQFEFEGQWWEIDHIGLPKEGEIVMQRRGWEMPYIWKSSLDYKNNRFPILRPVAPQGKHIVEDADGERLVNSTPPADQTAKTAEDVAREIFHRATWHEQEWQNVPKAATLIQAYADSQKIKPGKDMESLLAALNAVFVNTVGYDAFEREAAAIITAWGEERVREKWNKIKMLDVEIGNLKIDKESLTAENAALKQRVAKLEEAAKLVIEDLAGVCATHSYMNYESLRKLAELIEKEKP